MTSRRKSVQIGATEAPDVADEYLDDWEPKPLAAHFAIEDARLDGAALEAVDASGGRILRSRLTGVRAPGSRLRSLRLVDVIARDLDASNADWTALQLQRVVFEGCRLTGLTVAELEADEAVFRNCALGLASFRGATVRRSTFEDCVLDEADFGGARLREVRFAGCRIARADFEDARLERVDFRGSELQPLGVLSLRGAIVDPVQLVGLAPLLAQAVGIVVETAEN